MGTHRFSKVGARWAVILLAVFAFPVTAWAGERYVSGPGGEAASTNGIIVYPNIQAAIDAANEGDEVILAPFTFSGAGNRDLRLNGKAITVRSTDPNDANVVAATVIDCGASEGDPHRGFVFDVNEGPNSIVVGVSVVNGFGPSSTIGALCVSVGGAVFCQASSPKIMGCVFSGCVANDYGGAICCVGPVPATPTISGCTFLDNGAGVGGAIYSEGAATSIIGCTFRGNSAVGNGGTIYTVQCAPSISNCIIEEASALSAGGAICLMSGGSLTSTTISRSSSTIGGGVWGRSTISGCTIAGNVSLSNGGGLYVDDSNLVIEATTISNNASGSHGGGIYCAWFSGPSIKSCIIADNEAILNGGGVHVTSRSEPNLTNCTIGTNSAGSSGGGVFCDDTTRITLHNSILWGDTATQGAEIALAGAHTVPASATVAFCDVLGGQEEAYRDPNCSLLWGEGNIDADPLFVNPAGPDSDPNTWEDNDYHLAYGSPCRNVGDLLGDYTDELDIDGETRVMGGQVDIGADEWTYYTYTCGSGAGALAVIGFILLAASLARPARGGGRPNEQYCPVHR